MAKDPTTVDEYLATLPGNQRAALQAIREMIHRSAPDEIEEVLSFDVPTFKVDGKGLLALSAQDNKLALHIMSQTVMDSFRFAFKNWEVSKTTLHFKPDNTLPDNLVERLVKARMAENKSKVR
ncbi:DUF1801 domain-containing protein [bacterium]|nr:DUF1801 domain-containing protein [bacterium]